MKSRAKYIAFSKWTVRREREAGRKSQQGFLGVVERVEQVVWFDQLLATAMRVSEKSEKLSTGHGAGAAASPLHIVHVAKPTNLLHL